MALLALAADALAFTNRQHGPASALHDARSATTSLDMCPIRSFREALELVGAALPNAIEHAGGTDAIVSIYEQEFGNAECTGFEHPQAWQRSNRTGPGLIVNAGEGTTGTTCLDAVFTRLGLRAAHFTDDLRRESEWSCTNASWIDGVDCTAPYDRYDVVSDTPVPNHLPYILSSHPGSAFAGSLLTVRDPHDWAISRLDGHPTVLAAVPCGCRVSSIASLPGGARTSVEKCAPLEAPSTSVAGQQRLLIYDAWAACIVKEAGHFVSILNTFEMSNAELAARIATDFAGRGAFPPTLTAAQVSAAMAEEPECNGY